MPDVIEITGTNPDVIEITSLVDEIEVVEEVVATVELVDVGPMGPPGPPGDGEGGVAANASTTVKGITKLSVAPTTATDPIAAGDNDPRLSDDRDPTAHTHPTSEVTGLDAALADRATDAELTSGLAGKADASALTAHEAEDTEADDAHGAKTYVDAQIAGIDTGGDPSAAIATHNADTTSVHGIADTSALATDAEVASAVSTHEADTSVHGIADTTALATDAELAAAVSAHEADTSVHGIADTTALATDAEVTSAVGTHAALTASADDAHGAKTYTDLEVAAEETARSAADAVLTTAVADAQAEAESKQDELSGTTNTVDGKILVTPTADDQNAIVVKAPDGDWGDPDVIPYGSGQAFVVLKEDTSGATEPDDLVLFRIDRRGGLGAAGGMHVATGFRARAADSFNYSIHIDPTVDVPGILVDAASDSPTSAYQQWRLATGGIVAEINSAGAFKANRGIEVRSASTAAPSALQLGRGPTNYEFQFGIAAGANHFLTGAAAGDAVFRAWSANGGTGKIKIGSETTIRIEITPTGIGFFGATPVAKPTGVAVTAAGVHAALVSLGLIAA